MDIKTLRIELGVTKDEVSKKTGIPRTKIAKWEIGIGYPKPADELKLKNYFEKTNITNKDNEDISNTFKGSTGNVFKDLGDGYLLMYTPLITHKAAAGYTKGWGDEDYVKELPIHPVIVKSPHKGKYMSFVIFGDSMDNGSKEAIEDGDIVTGRQINRTLWKSPFHTHKYPDFIIHTLDGLVCKRILKHNAKQGVITLHSLNENKDKYPDYELNIDDIVQVFNIVQITKHR